LSASDPEAQATEGLANNDAVKTNPAAAVQAILSAAQGERFIIEDFRPLADSIEWRLGLKQA